LLATISAKPIALSLSASDCQGHYRLMQTGALPIDSREVDGGIWSLATCDKVFFSKSSHETNLKHLPITYTSGLFLSFQYTS